VSAETEEAIDVANKAAREARRLHIMDQHKAEIGRWGQCPMEWGHSEWTDVIGFGLVAFVIGLVIGMAIAHIAGCR
jgi:hypothetical protein